MVPYFLLTGIETNLQPRKDLVKACDHGKHGIRKEAGAAFHVERTKSQTPRATPPPQTHSTTKSNGRPPLPPVVEVGFTIGEGSVTVLLVRLVSGAWRALEVKRE
ncbi:hypothetical protein DRN74_07140 [Candidatus Micrarchaeota archaeon]|nr:MAG: hypothetical protein DRN74_07140 [Candidatus Micrarchaeota archaeon]